MKQVSPSGNIYKNLKFNYWFKAQRDLEEPAKFKFNRTEILFQKTKRIINTISNLFTIIKTRSSIILESAWLQVIRIVSRTILTEPKCPAARVTRDKIIGTPSSHAARDSHPSFMGQHLSIILRPKNFLLVCCSFFFAKIGLIIRSIIICIGGADIARGGPVITAI